MLHPNPFDSPGTFHGVYAKNGAIFDRPQAEPGKTPDFRRGWTPMGRRSRPIGPPARLPFIYIRHTCVCIHIYIYMYE